MSARGNPVMLIELRSGFTGEDRALTYSSTLPSLPWTDQDRELVARITSEMTRDLLRHQQAIEGIDHHEEKS